jgi:hypothetical protein
VINSSINAAGIQGKILGHISDIKVVSSTIIRKICTDSYECRSPIRTGMKLSILYQHSKKGFNIIQVYGKIYFRGIHKLHLKINYRFCFHYGIGNFFLLIILHIYTFLLLSQYLNISKINWEYHIPFMLEYI